MANEELLRHYYVQALINKQNTVSQGGNLLNPMQGDVSGLAAVDTGFQGGTQKLKPEEEEKPNGFDQFMNNVLGFVDEIAAKFGSGFVAGWEGGLDLIATGLGALGWDDAAQWAKQDIGTQASEWMKSAFGLGAWYDRARHGFKEGELEDLGKSFLDWNKAAFFAKNDLGDLRSQISDKYYGGNDEVLSQMNIGNWKAGEFLGGIAHSIGMMLPSIMTAGAAGAAGAGSAVQKGVSLATLGLGAAGKGSEEAMNDGATAQQALGYGALSGGAEVLSELAVGPVLAKVGLGTGKIMGVVGGKTVKATSKTFIKELAKNAFEEGMEEVSTAVVEPLLKSIYKGSDALKDYGTKEFWVSGNDSVLGQFASGAVTGGIMSGMSSAQQTKTFGKEGRNVVSAITEARENYKKLQGLTEGTAQYKQLTEETLKSLGEAVEAWNKAQGTLTEQQLKNLQQYIQNPGDFMQAVKENRKPAEVISEYINELTKNGEASLEKFGTRETAKRIFEAVDEDKMNIKFGKVEGDNNAQIKGKTIIINEKVADQAGKFLAHEFGVHALSNSIGDAEINKLYKNIVESKWLETKEGKSVDEAYKKEKKKDFKKYKEEIVANYVQDMVESKGSNQAQLQYLSELFSKPSFLQKFLRKFKKNAPKFPSNNAIETEFRNIIRKVVNSSNNKTYKAVIRKLQKKEKLNEEEAIAYRSAKEAFDLFKPQEAFSKKRNADTINEENNNGTEIQTKIIERTVGKDYKFSPKEIKRYVRSELVNRIEREWTNSGLNPTDANQKRLEKIIKIFRGEMSLLEPDALEAYKTFINSSHNTYYEKTSSGGTTVEVIRDNYLPPELLAIREDARNVGVNDVYFSASKFIENNSRQNTIGTFDAKNKDIYVRVFANSNNLGDFLGTYRHEFMHYALTYKFDLVEKYILQMRDVLEQSLGGRPNYYYSEVAKQFNNAQNQILFLEEVYDKANERYERFGFPLELQNNFTEWLKTNKETDENYYDKLAAFIINQFDIAYHLEEVACNFYSQGSAFFDGAMEELGIRYSKDRVLGNYTVGDNKQKLVVRRATKSGYEVYYPKEERTITEAEVGGEWAKNDKGIETRVNGETVKFDTENNVLKYLEDINAKRVEKVKSDKPRQKLTPPRTIELENAPTEAEMRKADSSKLKRVSFKKNVYVNDGSRIFKYVIKKTDTNNYHVQYENANGEMVEKDYTYKELRSEIDGYTRVSNKLEDVKNTSKKAEKPAKVQPKKEKTTEYKKVREEVKKPKQTKLIGIKLSEPVYVSDGKNVLEYEISKGEKQGDRVVKITDENGKTETKTVKYAEARSELNSFRKVSNTREDVLPKKYTYKSLETVGDIIKQSIETIEKSLGNDYKVIAPINMQDFAKRTFTDVNEVMDVEKEAARLVNKLLETQVENADREYIGTLDEMLSEKDIEELKKAAENIIKSAPNSEARTKATRAFEIRLEKAQAEAKEYKNSQSRIRVLTRIRDRVRRNVTRLYEVTNDEIVRNGLYTLLDPFEKLHGANNGGFSAKEFRDNLFNALDWYTEDNLFEKYPGLPYNNEIRAALESLYNSVGFGVERANGKVVKNLTAEQMQRAIETVRLINDNINQMIKNHTDRIAPASIQTKEAIRRSNYGKRANIIAGLIRMYKRGFAPSYVLLEEMLGGNSEAARILIAGIQNAVNEQQMYVGAYHDEINKKLKELGLKKTFDSKKFDFRGQRLTVDQMMGLYISTRVTANFDAMDQDGVVIFDDANNKYIDIAKPGEAQQLREEIDKVLPESYKNMADWLLTTMNSSVKSEYIKWFEDKFGKYQMRNEIGAIKDNSYWMLNRLYQKMGNLTKMVSNPDTLFSHAIRRTNGGKNAVMITGALGSFDAYIEKFGRELYIKPRYEEALAVLNTKGVDGESVMDVIGRRNDGTKDIATIKAILADILGANRRQGSLIDRMVSAFSVAKLSLNIGSMAKQFASAFTSNIPISKTAKALMARWSPEAKAEFKKLFDEIGGLKYREASKGILRANADSVGQFAEKIAQVGMIGISKVDLFTVSTGAYSLMVIGQDQYGYKIGSQENIDFVKEHWHEYELSQIGNSALSRNAISRSDSLTRYLFGFLQGANRAALGSQIHKYGLWERNRNVNKKQLEDELKEAKERLETAKIDYEANPDSDSARKAYVKANAEVMDLNNRLSDYTSYEIAGGKMIMPNMAAGIMAQGILVALVNALMKRIKGKKDWDELDLKEEALALAMAIGVDWVPLVNFISNMVQGYDVDIPATNLLNQMVAVFKSASSQDWDKMVRQIAWLVGDMTGIPFQTIYDYIYGTLKTFDPEIAYEFRSVFYGSTPQSAMNTMKAYSDAGKTEKAASMIDLIMKKYKTGSTTSDINTELATLYGAGYNALPKGYMTQYTNEDGEVVKLTAAQITQFMQIYGESTKVVNKLINSNEYRSLTAEERAKAIKKLCDAYYNMAHYGVVGGKVEGKLAQMLVLTNGNIDLAKYIVCLQKIGQITETNRKTRKDLVLEYINKLRGFTKAEKAMMMYLAGYTVSGTSATLLSNYLIRYGANRKQVKELLK